MAERSGSSRRYPRTARVNEVLREILAEELERMADADPRLYLLTITAVQVERDLSRATVLLASIPEEAATALAEHRKTLQGAVGRQVRFKRTPQLAFEVDPAIASGQRVEEILRSLQDDAVD